MSGLAGSTATLKTTPGSKTGGVCTGVPPPILLPLPTTQPRCPCAFNLLLSSIPIHIYSSRIRDSNPTLLHLVAQTVFSVGGRSVRGWRLCPLDGAPIMFAAAVLEFEHIPTFGDYARSRLISCASCPGTSRFSREGALDPFLGELC